MITKLRKSFGFAWQGLVIAWREEPSFKIELGAAVIALALCALLGVSRLEWALIIFIIFVILSVEALNTALEELCDKFAPDPDPHIAKIKDLAAPAVLLTSIGALWVAIIIFGSYL